MQIEFNNISFIYNKKDPNAYYALKDITLSIKKGEFLSIIGQTGSGKSTLIQMLNGLLKPTSGYVKVDDFIISGDKKTLKELLKNEEKDIQKLNKKLFKLRKKVGIVFQFPEYQLFSETVLKDVMFGPLNFGLKTEEAKKISEETLKKVGISERFFARSPFELSGGEKRRVAIAGILASNLDILVLDEPTAGLDPQGKEDIMELIKTIHQSGKIVIIVTHDMNVVKNYTTRTIVLHDGQLVKSGTPEEIFNDTHIDEYALEIPVLFKFKKVLKKCGFKTDFSKSDQIEDIVDLLVKEKKGGN